MLPNTTESALTAELFTVKLAFELAAKVEETVVITPAGLFKVTAVDMLVPCVTVPFSRLTDSNLDGPRTFSELKSLSVFAMF
jgi:hypothetical protein